MRHLSFFPLRGKNKTLKFSATLAFFLLFSSSLLFLSFSLYKTISSITHFGAKNYFWSLDLSKSPPNVNVWVPLAYTLIIVFSSVVLVNYSALRISKFLLRISEKYQRISVYLLKLLSIFPSFILSFVLFESIIPFFRVILGSSARYSLVWVFLSFFSILFPTTCLAYFNGLNSPEIKQLTSALVSLGIPTEKREKLYFKSSKGIIYICWANTLIKALGESISLSWFLSSDRYDKPFSSLSAFFSSQAHTISSLISSFYFSEGGGKIKKESMYVFGSVLLLSSMLINWYLQKKISNLSYKQSHWRAKATKVKYALLSCCERIYFSNKFLYLSRYIYPHRNLLEGRKSILASLNIFRKRLTASLTWLFFLSFVIIIIFKGIFSLFFNLFGGFYDNYSLSGLWVPLWNTFILLFFSLLLSTPIAFFSAFFLSAILKSKNLKQLISGFISGIGTAPPMLWAMFSSFFFIDYLNLSLGRVSVAAGILTFSIFALPFLSVRFFNLFERYLKKYSQSLSNLSLDSSYIWFLVLREGREKIKNFISYALIRLNGESGLLFITMGASPSSRLTLLGHGQTLTTRIFASLYKYEIARLKSTIYELIFFLLLLLFAFQVLFNSSFKKVGKIRKNLRRFYLKLYWNYHLQRSPLGSRFLAKFKA